MRIGDVRWFFCLFFVALFCVGGVPVRAQFATSISLSTLDGSNGFAVHGATSSDYVGYSVSGAGDFNGDGFDDFVVGAPFSEGGGSQRGSSYVVYGGASLSANINLSTLNGSNGFVLRGVATDDFNGYAVSGGGDINNDGFSDLIVASPYSNSGGTDRGSTYVVYGKATMAATLNLSTLNGTNGFALRGVTNTDLSGFSVANAGDMNGDGFDDVLIGAPNSDVGGGNSGSSYVLYGGATMAASFNLSTLNGTNGFIIRSAGGSTGQSGYSLSSAGDVNNDGFGDIIIGAPYADFGGADRGTSYVVYGAATMAATLNLSSLNGSNGFSLAGFATDSYSGWSVSGAGDFNGDGFDDIIVGAPKAGFYRSYIVYGSATMAAATTLPFSSPDPSKLFFITGHAANSNGGSTVSAAGDVNGDGFDDVIVGAYGSSAGVSNAGSSYIVYGRVGMPSSFDISALDPSTGFALHGISSGNQSGYSASSAGDVNNDGLSDILIGAPLASPNGAASGSSYIVYGQREAEVVLDLESGAGDFSVIDPTSFFLDLGEFDLSDNPTFSSFSLSNGAINDARLANDLLGTWSPLASVDGFDFNNIGAITAVAGGDASGESSILNFDPLEAGVGEHFYTLTFAGSSALEGGGTHALGIRTITVRANVSVPSPASWGLLALGIFFVGRRRAGRTDETHSLQTA